MFARHGRAACNGKAIPFEQAGGLRQGIVKRAPAVRCDRHRKNRRFRRIGFRLFPRCDEIAVHEQILPDVRHYLVGDAAGIGRHAAHKKIGRCEFKPPFPVFLHSPVKFAQLGAERFRDPLSDCHGHFFRRTGGAEIRRHDCSDAHSFPLFNRQLVAHDVGFRLDETLD